MIGLALGFITRPHAVGPAGIRVRSGAETDIGLAWDDVESVALSPQADEPKAPKVTVGDDGRRTLSLRMQNETNIEVVLERAQSVHLPSGDDSVDVVRFWVDHPREFLDEVRRYI
ncbi:MAG: SIMPL domain-containing protein, partial [Mycetocola sp.]